MPEQFVNGIKMYYEIHGAGEPLVLIMGLRRNVEWWYRQIPALSAQFKLFVFDNRGAGRSDKPLMDYSIRLFADDTAALMKSLGIENAHVLGVSMGGYIAQELAINHTGMVRSLILGCTGAGGKEAVLMGPERMKKFIANEGLSPESILKKDMDIFFSDSFILQNPDKIKKFSEISMRYYQPPDAFLRQFNACLQHDTGDRVSRIMVPTMVMSGDDDPLVPPENSRKLQKLIPHADLVFYPRLRHCFFIENSEEVNRKIINFLKSADQMEDMNR